MAENHVEAVLRDVHLDDAAAVIGLNNQCVPAVTAMDLEKARWYLESSSYFRVVVVDERRAPRAGGPDAVDERAQDEASAPPGPVVESGEHSNLAGFLNAMTPDVDYGSGNFKWFRERFGDGFVYLDRVAVSPWFRRRGIAARLYADLERWARERGFARIGLEVNVEPRNEGSLAFHERMGYVGIEERQTEYGPRVLMMEKML